MSAAATPRGRRPSRLSPGRIGLYAFLLVAAAFFLMPLYVMIVTSLKPMSEVQEGLIFARLADRHNEIDDAMRVVSMLALASTLEGPGGREKAAEAIARLELIANGDSRLAEDAAEILANCADDEQAATMQLAQQYRDRLTEIA